jgi:serine/threonine protein kinase
MAYRKIAKYFNLSVNVETSFEDAEHIQKMELKQIRENYFPDYEVFRPYLKHLYDTELTPTTLRNIQYSINELYVVVKEHIKVPIKNVIKVPYLRELLNTCQPFCTHKKEKGLTVKLFKIHKTSEFTTTKKPLILKIYSFQNKIYEYDSDVSFMYADMFKRNIMNEIVFQKYAEQIRKKENLDFIVPKIYDFGAFDYVDKSKSCLKVKCYFILMEYIEGITLKEALSNKGPMYEKTEELPDIRQKVNQIDIELKKNLLHHNDLHGNNILLAPDNKIAVIDYGEAAYGPHNGFTPLEGRF